MRVVIDTDKCIGAGMCLSVAPDLFELDSNGKATLKVVDPTEDQRVSVESAVVCCPTEAISVAD